MYPIINDPQNYSAALYLRLSKEDDNKKGVNDDSESIKNQRALLEGYAKEQKLTVYDVYIDDGFSGTSNKRPDFERMLDDISNHNVNMVITKDMSRLSRNYIDSGYYIELLFPEQQVRYVSLLDGIDTGAKDYTGDFTPFKAVFNDMYAKDISKKITSVKRDKQQKGLFIGGKAPYGYKKSPTEKNVIVVDEPAAEIVRDIFKLALEGKSCREIAIILNDKKIPTPATYANINLSIKGPYSGKWSSERISFMLQNEVYLGSMVQGRVKKASYKSKKCIKVPREDWQIVENTHEPLVDRETFDKVATLIQSRYNTRSNTYDFLLKGLIYCHECQKPLGVLKRKLAKDREVLYFVCRTYQRFTKDSACSCHCVRVEDVTNAVMEKVREICKQFASNLNLENITENATKQIQKELRKQGRDIEALKSKLDIIQLKIDKAFDNKLSGLVDDDDFQRVYTSLKQEQKDLRNKIQALENSTNEDIILDIQRTKELVEAFLNAEEYSRDLIVSLIKRVELTANKELHIHFRFKELELTSHL